MKIIEKLKHLAKKKCRFFIWKKNVTLYQRITLPKNRMNILFMCTFSKLHLRLWCIIIWVSSLILQIKIHKKPCKLSSSGRFQLACWYKVILTVLFVVEMALTKSSIVWDLHGLWMKTHPITRSSYEIRHQKFEEV